MGKPAMRTPPPAKVPICTRCGGRGVVRQGERWWCVHCLPKRQVPPPAATAPGSPSATQAPGPVVTFEYEGRTARVVDGCVVWSACGGTTPGTAKPAEAFLSKRTWAKGSARHAGPAVSQGAVLVQRRPWVPCEDCKSSRPAEDEGRHGAMPARLSAGEGGPGWPMCPHRVPYYVNCVGRAVPPPCCRAEARP